MVILEFYTTMRKCGWKIEIHYTKIRKDGAYYKHLRPNSFVENRYKNLIHT